MPLGRNPMAVICSKGKGGTAENLSFGLRWRRLLARARSGHEIGTVLYMLQYSSTALRERRRKQGKRARVTRKSEIPSVPWRALGHRSIGRVVGCLQVQRYHLGEDGRLTAVEVAYPSSVRNRK